MLKNINEEELLLIESLYYPEAAISIIFSDLDKMTEFDDNKLAHLWFVQLSMNSFEYLIAEDENLSSEENYKLLEDAGTLHNYGGRNFGKSVVTLIIDECLSLMHHKNWDMGFSSYDEPHIYGIQTKVEKILKTNPFLHLFFQNAKKHPSYVITGKNGSIIEAINMKIKSSKSQDAGEGFFQKHHKKVWVEERSFETEDVYNKRIDAKDMKFCIERTSGMTNFTRHTPAGRVFHDLSKRPFLLNLPQFSNPFWNEQKKQDAVKKYNGEHSIGYRVFVKGEVVEDGIAALDMERVRECYLEKQIIKFIEISKKDYEDFQNNLTLLLAVSRPSNCKRLWIASDIGDGAPTEINIFSERDTSDGPKYRWIYNIITRKLTDEEDYRVFKHLMEKLHAEFTGFDATEGKGKAIFHRAEKDFPKENLVAVKFNEKMPIAPELDENGNEIWKDGKLIYREDYVVNWAYQRAQDMLYNRRMELPLNHKFDEQASQITIVRSKTRVTYPCLASEDHCWQAFQVFFIMQWLNELNLIKGVNKKRNYYGPLRSEEPEQKEI